MRPIAILLLSSSLQLAQAQSPPPSQDGLPPVPTVSAPPSGQKPRGFALDIDLGTQLAALAGAGNIGLIQGGFFAGYKLDRFIFGVGFDLGARGQLHERARRRHLAGGHRVLFRARIPRHHRPQP